MNSRLLRWRIAPSGTEGTTTVYVHSRFGSDLYGDGNKSLPLCLSFLHTFVFRRTFATVPAIGTL